MTIQEYFKYPSRLFDYKSLSIPDTKNDNDLLTWLLHASGVPHLPLELPEAPFEEMYKEALALEDVYVKHRTGDYENSGWKSICLHGEAWDKTDYWTSYPENKGKTEDEVHYVWTDIADRCPVTTKYFKESFIHSGYKRLRFMWLEPRGYIMPHCDGTKHFLGAINVALNNPDGCEFRMGGYTVPFRQGNAMLLDVATEHAIWNNSDIPRIHMIVHGSRYRPNYNKFILENFRKQLDK
jgi:hypothetical protein